MRRAPQGGDLGALLSADDRGGADMVWLVVVFLDMLCTFGFELLLPVGCALGDWRRGGVNPVSRTAQRR